MSKLIAIAVVVAGSVLGVQASAQAAGHGCSCQPAASAAPATAQANGANVRRSYSYEPTAPVYRSRTFRSQSSQPSYLQGGSKALGRY